MWHQRTTRLSGPQRTQLEAANIIEWFLSPTVQIPDSGPSHNDEPLLLNTVGSLSKRPTASTNIDNFFLASDYVRTHTDLATMESANEAARQAVNGVLARKSRRYHPCRVYSLREPAIFEPMKAYDRLRFQMGLPHHRM